MPGVVGQSVLWAFDSWHCVVFWVGVLRRDWLAAVSHKVQGHGVDQFDMEGHYIIDKAREELISKKKLCVTHAEYQSVAPNIFKNPISTS